MTNETCAVGYHQCSSCCDISANCGCDQFCGGVYLGYRGSTTTRLSPTTTRHWDVATTTTTASWLLLWVSELAYRCCLCSSPASPSLDSCDAAVLKTKTKTDKRNRPLKKKKKPQQKTSAASVRVRNAVYLEVFYSQELSLLGLGRLHWLLAVFLIVFG